MDATGYMHRPAVTLPVGGSRGEAQAHMHAHRAKAHIMGCKLCPSTQAHEHVHAHTALPPHARRALPPCRSTPSIS